MTHGYLDPNEDSYHPKNHHRMIAELAGIYYAEAPHGIEGEQGDMLHNHWTDINWGRPREYAWAWSVLHERIYACQIFWWDGPGHSPFPVYVAARRAFSRHMLIEPIRDRVRPAWGDARSLQRVMAWRGQTATVYDGDLETFARETCGGGDEILMSISTIEHTVIPDHVAAMLSLQPRYIVVTADCGPLAEQGIDPLELMARFTADGSYYLLGDRGRTDAVKIDDVNSIIAFALARNGIQPG